MALVGICTPHADKAPPTYSRALDAMQLQFPQHQFLHVEVDTTIVHKARNMLVDTARLNNVEIFWFIDDDTLIPPGAGVLVDQARQLGVVSGVYFNRHPPFTPQIYRKAEEEHLRGMYWPLLEYPESGLRQEDAIGAGCVAVRSDVFSTVEEYWKPRIAGAANLLKKEYPELAEIVGNLSPWFEFLNRKGEDFYFSERLREAGVEIWVNYDVKCIHLTYMGIHEDHFKFLMDNNLIKVDPV